MTDGITQLHAAINIWPAHCGFGLSLSRGKSRLHTLVSSCYYLERKH